MSTTPPFETLWRRLRELRPGARLLYVGWRGDFGEAQFVAHWNDPSLPTRAPGACPPAEWRRLRSSGLVVQRQGFIGTSTFLPFYAGSDRVVHLS